MSHPLDLVCADFISHGNAHGWSPITVANYRQRLGHVVRFLRGRGCRRLADVTPADLDALMQGEADRGSATSSRVGLAILVRSLFAWCLDQGRLVSNPARGLPLPNDGEADLPDQPLSASDIHALFASLPRWNAIHLRNACVLEFLYGCGLRRSEALGLDLEDVNLTQRTVWVHGKGGQDRLLPLMGTAVTAAQDWLSLRRSLLHGPDLGAFFLTRDGKRMASGTLDGLFRDLNAARGPEARHLHPHLLRHSIAVHLLQGGADVRHIQAFLGHASLDTTKIYLRLVPGRLKEDYDQAMPEIATGLPVTPSPGSP